MLEKSEKEILEDLKMKSMFLEAVMNSSADGILVVDQQGKKVLQNKKTNELWKIDPEVAADPDGSRQVAHVMKMTKNPEQFKKEIEHQMKFPMDITTDQLELIDGTVLDRHSAPVIGEDGENYGRIYHFHDVTNFRQAEDQIRGLLKEKETILREVHHRVKNYMGIVTSLLAFQAQTLENESAFKALQDTQDRIRCMTTLYDKLYVSADLKATSAAHYFPSLFDEIISIFPSKTNVLVEKEIEDITLDANTLQILSIIINELLTNSMKYAFDEQHDPKIRVSIKKSDKQIILTIEDNGKGIPDAVDPENSVNGFGLLLVNTLVLQQSGEIKVRTENGTKISIVIRNS